MFDSHMRGWEFAVAFTVLLRYHAVTAADLPGSPPREEPLDGSSVLRTVEAGVVGLLV